MIFKRLQEDIDSIAARDPAARSRFEVLVCYPGLHALFFYRLANGLWRRGFTTSARLLSQIGRMLTGIEIHPGATIGRHFFIDHGMGVVIGETAVIGDEVTIYHGVTLGGTTLHKGKRHPTLEDGVIVGSGAQILGPITVGAGARIGANAVVLSDVPKGVTMVGIPARIVMRRAKMGEGDTFHAYGLSADNLPDPVVAALETLRAQLAAMSERMAEMEERQAESEGIEIDKTACARLARETPLRETGGKEASGNESPNRENARAGLG
jgi:serine O-acetyltransferase